MKALSALAACLAGLIAVSHACGQTEAGKPKDTKVQEKKTPPKKDEPKEESLDVGGTLNRTDPTDPARPGCHYKLHNFAMRAGKTYVIELHDVGGTRMDPYLCLDDSTGARLAQDDDGAGNLNSRIIFSPTKDDTYRIFATTLSSGRTGSFRLTARSVPPGWRPPPLFGPSGIPIGMARPIITPMFSVPPTTIGDIVVTPLPHMGHVAETEEDTHGYLEYRLVLENRSEAQTHDVELIMPRYRGNSYYGHHLRSLRKAVSIGPGGTVEVSLFQPDMPMPSAGEMQISIDGSLQERSIPTGLNRSRGGRTRGYHGKSTTGMGQALPILSSPELAQPLSDNVYKCAVGAPPLGGPPFGAPPFGAPGRGGRSGNYLIEGPFKNKPYNYDEGHQFVQGPGPVSGWSKHWLGYSSFAGVAVTARELQAASSEVRRALFQCVECGGALLVLGEFKLPEHWERSATQNNGFRVLYPGFGQCLVATTDIGAWDPDAWRVVTAAWDQSGKRWSDVRSATEANRAFPVVSSIGIPVRGMFAVMLVFVVLIGPINFVWLNRSRRRIWLLWTVPLLSLVTCGLLFGYMVLSEGWHGHVRASGVAVLDEVNQRAATIGWMGYYSPTTPGGGLRFDAETELTPQMQSDFRHYGPNRNRMPCTIDWTEDQHLDSGWVTAKVPSHFAMRRNEKRLERILLRKQGETPTAFVNSLNADIKKIWVAAANGAIYSAENVVAGAEAPLISQPEKATGEPNSLRAAFTTDWLQFAKSLAERPSEFLRPGCYVAILEESPFLEQGLRKTQLRELKSVVYGIMKE